ncbi:MAG: protoglobin domain-containing protein [Xanthobacteraceae bacterium]
MSTDDNLRGRLAFIRIDEQMRATLRELKPLAMKALPGVLDGFYAQVGKYPEVARLFSNPAQMRNAKELQIRHWGVVLGAAFDDAYCQSATRIGEAHSRLGLQPRWYIGGYSFILSGLLRAIEIEVSSSRFNSARQRERKAQMMAALVAATMLDMDLAISVYLDSEHKQRHDTLDRLANSFDASVGGIIRSVSSAASDLETAATKLSRTAESTQQISTSVAATSEQASANVKSVASATDEMSSSVNEISRQVQESSKIAREAVMQAQKTDTRIAELSQAASRIGDVVKLITAIAEQTNLLALNATIEAARAGEAGRGFAVVAQEVKALAAQTAKATDEIGTQIASMQTATQDSVAAIKEIGGTIDRIAEIAGAIAAAVEEQGAATQEIARNVQEAARGTADVAVNIADVNKGAGETSSAAGQLTTSARALSREGNKLKLEVDKFLTTVRAA